MLFPALCSRAARARVAAVHSGAERCLSPAARVPFRAGIRRCRQLLGAQPTGPVLASGAAGSCFSLFQL